MNFDEALSVRVSLDAFAPVMNTICTAMFGCTMIIALAIVVAATIRTLK